MIKNENVVGYIDYIESVTKTYLVLEYIEGSDLKDYMLKRKYLSEQESVQLLIQIVNGLMGLHSRGIIHRE